MRNLSIPYTLATVLLCRHLTFKSISRLLLFALVAHLIPTALIARDVADLKASLTTFIGSEGRNTAAGLGAAIAGYTWRNEYFQDTTKITVTGQVMNSAGESLAGASITVRNGGGSAMTDIGGNFSIRAAGNATLVISYVGYTTQEVAVGGNAVLNVVLSSDLGDLDEVVVVGYNTQKRGSISGAISSVSIADVEKRRVPNVAQALQGQVAGVNVTSGTGAPGDPIDIRIRGVGTIGNNNPLFIIDGIATTNSTFINSLEIESISVLKDASAAAIYGSRAAGGVIIITTKKGSKTGTNIDLNYFNGVQKVANLPKMMNSEQYLNKVEEAWNNSNSSGTNPYTAQKSRTDLANTDWLDELFESGRSQSAQLSINGGSEKVQVYLGGGYYRQDGIVVFDNDRYRRINFRANINANLTDRITVGTNLQIVHERRNPLSSRGDAPGIIRHALIRPPVIPVYKDPSDPTYTQRNPFTDLPFYKSSSDYQNALYEQSQNPIALAYFTDQVVNQFKNFGNIFGEYAFLSNKALKFRTNIGFELNYNHSKGFFENFGDEERPAPPAEADPGQGRHNRPNGLNEDRGEDYTFTWNNTLGFQKQHDKHDFNALVGMEFITNQSSSINGSRRRYEFTSNEFHYLDLGPTDRDIWNGGFATEFSLFSYFGTATYMYDNKYMATVNLRADASSRFPEENQWGYFPSFSLGWVMSEESFLKGSDFISYLKLRISSGALGNQSLPIEYAYRPLYSREGVLRRYGNPDLKWETTIQNNIGLDASFLNNRLDITADYFLKTTKDILLGIGLPGVVGNVDATFVNAAEVTNKGFELGIRYRNAASSAFNYSVMANMATLKNNVEKLHPNLPVIAGTVTRAVVGQPLDVFYGYMMEGIYQNTAEVAAHLHGTPSHTIVPGDIKFKDLNDDGIINDLDRTYIGNSIPKLSYGFNFNAGYKGFDLSFLLQGVAGVDRFNDGKQILDYDTRPFNYTTNMLNSWNGEGSSNTIPRAAFVNNGSNRISSVFVEDASYFRIRNVELGYNLRSVLRNTKIGIENARIYVSGQNLLTATKYTGLDPEVSDAIDKGTYPQSKAILFGININF